jgi:hypothetical protein
MAGEHAVGQIATIKNAIYKLFADAPGKSLNVDLDDGYTDTAEMYHLPGVYSKPHDDDIGVVLEVNGLKIVIASHNYKLDKDVDKGNVIIYSIDSSGAVKGSVLFNQAGEAVFHDGTDYAVAYNDLKSAFDTLKSEHDNIVTAFNAHVHPTAAVGAPSPPTAVPGSIPALPSTADMSGAKVTTVRLP